MFYTYVLTSLALYLYIKYKYLLNNLYNSLLIIHLLQVAVKNYNRHPTAQDAPHSFAFLIAMPISQVLSNEFCNAFFHNAHTIRALHLCIAEPVGSSAPKFQSSTQSSLGTFRVHQQAAFAFTCPAQGSPTPTFRWIPLKKLMHFLLVLLSLHWGIFHQEAISWKVLCSQASCSTYHLPRYRTVPYRYE